MCMDNIYKALAICASYQLHNNPHTQMSSFTMYGLAVATRPSWWLPGLVGAIAMLPVPMLICFFIPGMTIPWFIPVALRMLGVV